MIIIITSDAVLSASSSLKANELKELETSVWLHCIPHIPINIERKNYFLYLQRKSNLYDIIISTKF